MQAGQVGVCRQVQNLKRKCKTTYGADSVRSAWQYHVDGALGELAFSKWKGMFYDGAIGDYSAKDVGQYQIRTTTWPKGKLLLHDRDLDDDIFVLALAHDCPTIYLAGWIPCSEGKIKQYWEEKTGRPAYFVPQESLNPMDELPNL